MSLVAQPLGEDLFVLLSDASTDLWQVLGYRSAKGVAGQRLSCSCCPSVSARYSLYFRDVVASHFLFLLFHIEAMYFSQSTDCNTCKPDQVCVALAIGK